MFTAATMSTSTLFPSSYNARSTLCRRCLLLSLASRKPQRRSIGLKYLAKQDEAERHWLEKAELIKEGKEPHLWDMFKERGYVKDIAGTENQIRELMRTKRIGAYVGVDPTAPSLHLGHLLPLMPLFWMYIHGFTAISVIGGATAKIGDPTDRLSSREKMAKTDMTMNITKMHYQLKRIWINLEAQARRFGYEKNWAWRRALINNSQWYNNLPFIEVVSRLFKGMRMGPMLSRETVKRKMNEGDGMSLDEFVYPLMQAWDWWHLFNKRGVMMQIGGSDQYGNIVSGIEAVKYLRDTETHPAEKKPADLHHTPVGFTVPLLTDSSGAKFGKSAGNAIWLDQFMTPTFDLYGYFMRQPDSEMESLLGLFTFHPMEKIKEIMEQHNLDPSKRVAHHALAYEVVALAYGLDEATRVQNRHRGLFAKGPSAIEREFFPPADETRDINKAATFQVDIELPQSLILGKSISRIIHAAGLADSVSDATRLTHQQGAYVGGSPGQPAATNKGMSYGELTFTPVKSWFPQDTRNFLIDGKLLILRRGKHFIRVIRMVTDEEWALSGKMYPGEPGTGRIRRMVNALKQAADSQGVKLTTSDSRKLLSRSIKLWDQNESASAPASDDPSADDDAGPARAALSKSRIEQIFAKGVIPSVISNLEAIETPKLYTPPSRAAQLLQKAEGSFRPEGASSTREKTEAIDRILERTQKILTDERDKQAALREANSRRR
ncbi:hypothetical protein F4779DRAFT_600328 [Xylariaceae sp. FL0662B]|nr:hypothetical protein F4779DRAFT_600328 [Xylariaceae sp. FL0662B]